MDLKKLRDDLTIVTTKDLDKFDRKDFGIKGSIIAIMSDYAFNCNTCEEIAPWLNPYRIRKTALTSFGLTMTGFAKGTHRKNIKSVRGILHLSSLESEPEYDSALNWVWGIGYVCDHCYDSIFNDCKM